MITLTFVCIVFAAAVLENNNIIIRVYKISISLNICLTEGVDIDL